MKIFFPLFVFLFFVQGNFLAFAATEKADDSAAAESCSVDPQDGFSKKFYQIYRQHLQVTGEEPTTMKYRGTEAPLSSPPFPSATWNIGGTSPIGYEDTTVAPMMDAIYCGKNGKKIKDSRIKVYGWLNPGFNFSSSKSKYSTSAGNGGNYPAAYYVYPNSIQLDQAALYIERVPDTVQTKHVDYGFRIANLYGSDYKYTFSNKVASQQSLRDHKQYGFDPVMFYGDVYVPQVAQGMNIRVGRYISIPDIEAQLAPNNYTYSHSLLYSYDPFTHQGIVNTIKLNKNWTIQGEVSAGGDVAVWDKRNRKLSGSACVNWTSDSGNDNIYPCVNGINSGKYAYNNPQMLVATWYHKFDKKWHMATEGWYMWERKVPNLNNADAPALINGANGAYCKSWQKTCRAKEFAAVNYLVYQFAPKDFLTLRNEFFNDQQGQRTGYKTLYTEHLIGWTHWIGDVITIRPELRFEHSYYTKAYDGGNKSSQYIFATDMIVHF